MVSIDVMKYRYAFFIIWSRRKGGWKEEGVSRRISYLLFVLYFFCSHVSSFGFRRPAGFFTNHEDLMLPR